VLRWNIFSLKKENTEDKIKTFQNEEYKTSTRKKFWSICKDSWTLLACAILFALALVAVIGPAAAFGNPADLDWGIWQDGGASRLLRIAILIPTICIMGASTWGAIRRYKAIDKLANPTTNEETPTEDQFVNIDVTEKYNKETTKKLFVTHSVAFISALMILMAIIIAILASAAGASLDLWQYKEVDGLQEFIGVKQQVIYAIIGLSCSGILGGVGASWHYYKWVKEATNKNNFDDNYEESEWSQSGEDLTNSVLTKDDTPDLPGDVLVLADNANDPGPATYTQQRMSTYDGEVMVLEENLRGNHTTPGQGPNDYNTETFANIPGVMPFEEVTPGRPDNSAEMSASFETRTSRYSTTNSIPETEHSVSSEPKREPSEREDSGHRVRRRLNQALRL